MFLPKSVVLKQHIFAAWGTFDNILRVCWLSQKTEIHLSPCGLKPEMMLNILQSYNSPAPKRSI